jgi:protein-S-isoprenylcysteine O-methyltransferase Ste14
LTPNRLPAGIATDLAARALVIILFSLLSANLLQNFLRTGHVTGLLLLASESLVVVLMFIRRHATIIDRSAAGIVTTAASLAGPPLFRAIEAPGLVPDTFTAAASAVGLGLVITGKVALGRSFGIVPANRGVVIRGPYGFVRHPIYTGYLITHVGFVVAHPSAWNVAVLLLADGALVARALIEERVLSRDEQYRSYCQRVGWHLMPGVF